jgi:opacity protein-like surface antigen
MRLWLSAVGSVVGSLLVADLHALEPPATHGRTEAMAGIRYGTRHLDFGPGLRGGYTLANGIYLGGALDYFLGERRSEAIGTARMRATNNLWLVAVEAGYDLGLTRQLVLRPWGGAGIGWTHGKTCQTTAEGSTCTTSTKSDAVFELGLLGEYAFGPVAFGPEVRWVFSSDSSVVFGLSLGWLF